MAAMIGLVAVLLMCGAPVSAEEVVPGMVPFLCSMSHEIPGTVRPGGYFIDNLNVTRVAGNARRLRGSQSSSGRTGVHDTAQPDPNTRLMDTLVAPVAYDFNFG